MPREVWRKWGVAMTSASISPERIISSALVKVFSPGRPL